jgi:hypothetical protein
MLRLYRGLLRLYPAAHRAEFEDEMCEVLADRESECGQGLREHAAFFVREACGILGGAAQEHFRALGVHAWIPYTERSFGMRNGFRFPKSTPALMAIILAGVVLAIRKGEAIGASLPQVNPPLGPIRPEHLSFLPPLLLAFGLFYAAGLAGWAVLFLLRRSGVHRLAGIASEQR